jgi:hypothetical protein
VHKLGLVFIKLDWALSFFREWILNLSAGAKGLWLQYANSPCAMQEGLCTEKGVGRLIALKGNYSNSNRRLYDERRSRKEARFA